jgi:dihydropyrimidine dehydrogenase (NAD+) subunit PreT
VEFIEKLRLQQHAVTVPAKVIVLGGGNTAMDAASESARMGAQSVVLAYRRSQEEMRAYGFEYELAKGAGVQGLFNASPVEIVGQDKVEAVRFVRTQNVDGKLKNIPGSEFTLPCDWVIRATGQQKMTGFLGQIPKLELDAKGRIVVDPVRFQCTNPLYFAGGDAVNGGAEVVNAAAEGKKAAQGIHQYLSQ